MTHALIFANGDANDGDKVRQVLATAAAHDALIIAADGGARNAAIFGVRPQLVVGDMDSIAPEELEQLAGLGAEILRSPVEKDETDLELALNVAAERGARWVRVIGAIGDRLDQTLSNVALLALPALSEVDARMVAGKQEAWLIGAGTHTIDGAAGDTVSLLPMTGAVRGVRTESLYYPLRDEDLLFGLARGVSNVMQGERAQVSVREGILLVVHTMGRA